MRYSSSLSLRCFFVFVRHAECVRICIGLKLILCLTLSRPELRRSYHDDVLRLNIVKLAVAAVLAVGFNFLNCLARFMAPWREGAWEEVRNTKNKEFGLRE